MVCMDRLTDKVGLITGAASGIGLATCELLLKNGATVIMSDLSDSEGQNKANKLGNRAVFETLDVTSEEGWITIRNKLLKIYSGLDFIVNNAVVGTPGSIEETSLDQWRQIHAVNSEGPFLGCKYGLELIKKNGRGGSIVNISSVAGIIGAPNLTAYCSSKASVRLLTKSVALHCARKGYGIRCNSVHPSYTDTPMVDEMVAEHRTPEKYKIALETASPMGRLGTPHDVAGAVLYLISDESKFVTGSEIVVDGGLTAT